MIESATFHVITTELVVGSFALAGLCFVLHSLISIQNKESQFVTMMDSTAHIALLFGLLALPFAIVSGINSSPSGAPYIAPSRQQNAPFNCWWRACDWSFVRDGEWEVMTPLDISTTHSVRSLPAACSLLHHLGGPTREQIH